MRRWSKLIFVVLSVVMAAELGVQLYHQVRGALAARAATPPARR